MSVEIDPQELAFQRMCHQDAMEIEWSDRTDLNLGPFNAEVTQILKIKNPSKLPVAFKVRTLQLLQKPPNKTDISSRG